MASWLCASLTCLKVIVTLIGGTVHTNLSSSSRRRKRKYAKQIQKASEVRPLVSLRCHKQVTAKLVGRFIALWWIPFQECKSSYLPNAHLNRSVRQLLRKHSTPWPWTLPWITGYSLTVSTSHEHTVIHNSPSTSPCSTRTLTQSWSKIAKQMQLVPSMSSHWSFQISLRRR